MKETRLLMGMPIILEVVDPGVRSFDLEKIFDFFQYVDNEFSPFKPDSAVSRLNDGRLKPENYDRELREILDLSEETKQETDGYFDIYYNGHCNPSGLVKGWAIHRAAQSLKKAGFNNYYINAGGDIEVAGTNQAGQIWKVGIRNPFNHKEIVKVLGLSGRGIATSGTYQRGQHIYNPLAEISGQSEIVSLTVVGPNVYEADRFATAAFAMGRDGLTWLEQRPGLEAYQIDKNGQAAYTSGFNQFIL